MRESIVLDSKQLKCLRKKHALSQELLAAQSIEQGYLLSLSTIKRAERGMPISYRTALNYSRFFAVKLSELIASNTATATLNNKPLTQIKQNKAATAMSNTQTTDWDIGGHTIEGRKYEIMQFQHALEICVDSQRNCVFYLRGISGIGKSALVRYFQQLARSQSFQTIAIYPDQTKLNKHTPLKILQINTPLAIIVEDLHLSPSNFLNSLKHLIADTRNNSIIFIFTASLKSAPLDFLWQSGIISTSFISINLGRLSEPEHKPYPMKLPEATPSPNQTENNSLYPIHC